jgi:hypothetical protein
VASREFFPTPYSQFPTPKPINQRLLYLLKDTGVYMQVAVLDKSRVKTNIKDAFAVRKAEQVYAEIEELEKEIEEKEIEKEIALSELDFVNGDAVTLDELKTSIEQKFGFKL